MNSGDAMLISIYDYFFCTISDILQIGSFEGNIEGQEGGEDKNGKDAKSFG